MISFELPWPPSINNYWRRHGNTYFISIKGKKYREDVVYSCFRYKDHFKDDVKISINIDAFPPDKRRRDLDNVLKALLDSLQHAKVFKDDNQIDRLYIARCMPLIGKVVVTLSECA